MDYASLLQSYSTSTIPGVGPVYPNSLAVSDVDLSTGLVLITSELRLHRLASLVPVSS